MRRSYFFLIMLTFLNLTIVNSKNSSDLDIFIRQLQNKEFILYDRDDFETDFYISFQNLIFLGLTDKFFFISIVLLVNSDKVLFIFIGMLSFSLIAGLSLFIRFFNENSKIFLWMDIISSLVMFVFGFIFMQSGVKMPNEIDLQRKQELNRQISLTFSDVENEKIENHKNEKPVNNNLNSIISLLQFFIIISLSQIGDKSQVATFLISPEFNSFSLFFSYVFSHSIIMILAVLIGKCISFILTEKSIIFFSGILYLSFGLINLYIIFIDDFILSTNVNYSKESNNFKSIPLQEDILKMYLNNN